MVTICHFYIFFGFLIAITIVEFQVFLGRTLYNIELINQKQGFIERMLSRK